MAGLLYVSRGMDLTEVLGTELRPYRCYVRGDATQTEGEHVHTIGFKDGIAVVRVVQDNMRSAAADNAADSKSIDLSKLKKIIVKIDPKTGKKFIHKDGKKIEILPQVSNPIITLKPTEKTVQIKMSNANERNLVIRSPLPGTPGAGRAPENQNIVLRGPANFTLNNLSLMPKLVPTGSNVKVFDNVKYHVLQMNMKKPTVDKNQQTDSLDRREVCTQTDPFYCGGRESPFTDTFFDFILGSESSECDGASPRKMIDPNKLRTKEEIHKFNFFNDMRNALNFDKTGNLPIHNSVMQNDAKAVQKNCIVLRAVKETADILNQQCYAPLHLAVIYDVSPEVVRILLLHKADVRILDPEGNTPIHLAIEHGRTTMFKMFVNTAVESKYNLDIFNYEGFTPLIMACLNHSYDDAKFLLQNGANPNEKDMKSGRTALFHAAEGHDVNLVELLMQNKADTKIRNFFGTSPHDAMFELDEIPFKIKFSILGRDHQRIQNKKRMDGKGSEPGAKKAKLTTTPVLRKVSTSDLIGRQKRK